MTTEVESKEPISEKGSIGAAAATDNSSISHETAKNEALCTVAVGTLDSSEDQTIVEAPKETLSKHAGIASEELKSRGDLTSNGDNIEAKEEVTAAKEPAESESSDVNVMATNNGSAKEENTSQNRLPQKDQDQDDKIVHAQVTKLDIIEASKAQAEDKEGEGTTDNEKHEVNGDNIKREAENRKLSDESTNSIYNTGEPFEKKNSKEPPEIMNEGLEPIDKFESPIGAVPEEQDVEKFERVDEDEHVKTEAETGICNLERTNVTDCISVAERSEEGITQESLEKTSEEQVEPANGEQEHYKPESFQEPEEEKLKRVNEDDINIETETEICAAKGLDYADSMSVSENSDKEIDQEPPEVTAKNGPESAKEESEHGKLETSHDAVPDEPEEKEEAQNGTCDDKRTKKFEPEHEELEKSLDEVTGEPEEELERVIEDEKIKMEAETELCAEERTTDADSISVAEPSENESRQEPTEIMVKEAHEPAEDVPEKSECESTLDAVFEKPEGSMLLNNGSESCRPNRNHENESTSKEDVVMNAPEDDKEYKPIEKEALNLPPEYESGSVGAAAATDNSSISHETAKDEALCTVAVGILDGSEGQIIVEAPKETLSKHAEIDSEELKDEGDLASTGDNIEAKEKVIAATEPAESEISDVNVMAIENESAKEENASQHRLQQKDQDQDDKIVHAQVTKTDIVEASEAHAEDKEDESTTDNEKHEVNGDNINREAENQMLSDESTDSIYNTSAADSSTQIKDPPEIMNEDLEPADKFESHIGAVPEEPDVEKFGKANEDEHVKVEAEARTCNLERTNVSDYVSVAEPSGEGSIEESLEKTSEEELEPAKGEQEHDKPECFEEPEEEKLKTVDEDDIKMEAETEICADKEHDYADSMSVAENSDKEVEQEPPEVTAKNGPEHEKEESEHGMLETSLDTVPNEPEDKAEAENRTGDDERTKKFEAEHEIHEKSLDEVTGEPEEELEKVIEDKKIKLEAETELCSDERTADAGSISVAEPSESESRQEPKEIMVKEAHEPAEDVPEKSELESTHDAVLEKPEGSMLLNNGSESCRPNRNHENESTSKEDVVMNAPEDDKEYKPIEKEALNLPPEYERGSVGAAAATDNSSISHKTAKDEALCTVAVGILDGSEGQIIVEAPKQTLSKHAEIDSEELKDEGDLASTGDNMEAKEKVIAATEPAESESSDVNVMAIENESAKEENASQHRLQQKDQDQDDKIVHAQVTKTDIVEASEAHAEDKEDVSATDNEKHEVNGDNINREAENQMLSDESTDSIYNTSAAEPYTKIKDPPEIMNEDLEPADKFESHIGAVPEEPDVEKFGKANEDEHVKVEAEARTCNLERTNVSDYVSVAEPSGEGSIEESLEKTSKEELEPAKGEQEHDKPECFKEPEEEKLKRVDEDDIKMEAETEICADKELDYADSMSVAENSDKEVEQEPPEVTAKNGPEHEKEESEHGKPETSLDTVPNEPEEKAEAENRIGDDERTKKFESEHERLEKSLDEVTGEPEEELEKVIEDKKIKMEAETELCADERTADAGSISVAEPSESESRQEPKEIMVKEAHDPAEDVPEKSELESTHDAVLEKPECSMLLNNGSESCRPNRNHENESTSKEDVVMNAPEHDKEYKPIEKEALNLPPEYESTSAGAAAENRGISHETAKDEAFCTVAVGTLDSSEGQIIVEAPKETVTKHAEIASEELKNEGDLTSNGDNTEAKENVTADKNLEESESSDVNVMAIHKKRATHETMSQDSLHQNDQDDNIVHAQAKKFSMVEASEAEAGDKEDEDATDIEKLEGNSDNIKKEAENGMPSDESANGIDNTPAAEPLEKNNSEEPHEITKKDLEPEDKFESPIDAAPEELDVEKLERVNEAKYVKVEAETGKFNDERTDGINFISLEEPSEKGNTEESLEKTSKEKLEAAEDEPGHEKTSKEKLEAAENEPGHDKLKSFLDSEEEKLGRVNEDNDKIEGEAEICADERTDDVVHSMTVAEPSDNKQEPVEIATKEDPESAKDEPEHGKQESFLEPVAHELEEKEPERIDEDTNVKIEAENGICEDKITNGIDSISAAEPSDKENRQEPLEMTAKENLGPEKDELDHIKLEKSLHVVTKELEEKLERVIEDEKIKFEAETEICDNERTADADNAPVLEPSENENRQEPIEVTAKEYLEPAEDVQEHSEPESSLAAVLQKPEASMVPDSPESSGLNRNHEIKTMSTEALVMTLEECSLEDEKKHEPLVKEADDFIQEYENIHVGNDKHEEIPDSTCEEQSRETINHSIGIELDGKERELSQKLELVSDSVAEDKNHEVIRQKDFDVSPDDCILQNVISEMVEKNDDEESTREANLNKAFDDSHDSHVSIEETINKGVGQKKEEGSSSAYDDQNHQATDTTDKLEVHVSGEQETQQNIFQVSLPEDRCQKETGESDALKIDNSSNDEDPKTKIPGAADLNKDAETAKVKSEENLHTAKEDCSDDHTSIAPIIPDQIGEHEDSSETEYGEQISRVISDECSIQADIHKETADPEEFEKITESIPKDHNQGGVIEPKSVDNSDNTDNLDEAIPEITAHGDDPETAKVKDEVALEKDFSYKCDDQESYLGAAKCEDNKEASIHEKTENLDSNMCPGPEDQSHDVLCETESVKVEKEQNIDENEKSSAVRTEYITDATSGAKLEEISVGDSYEVESDDKQKNAMFEIIEEKMPKEETAGHILEKTLSTLNTNTSGDISENQIEGKDSAKNTNSIIIGCEQNQATEEEIPEVASRDRNKESDAGDDSTTNGTTSEEVKVSDTAGVAKKLTETVEVQISEDASQVMKVDAYECQDYEENDECKENTNTSQMLEKSVQNENEEKMNKIHDDLAVTDTPSDEATHGNLHKNEGKKATTEDYGTGYGISNQEANESEDGELKDKGSISISNDNACDIPALDKEHGQVENAHQEAADSSCDHIHGSISTSEVDNLDARIIENKIEQKSYESDRACESNESVKLKETTENDSEKEKLEDSEPEKSTHAVVEDLEITTGAECIQESETNNVSTKNNNEENFLKDRDMKRVEPATELKPDQQSNKAIYATEGNSPIEETINVKDLVDDVAKEKAHNEDKQCEDDDVSVAHNLVEESMDMEGKEPHLQKESMELETHRETEQNDRIVAQHEEVAERTATLKLHKDTEHIEQSNLLGNQEIATQIENIEKDIMPDKDAAEADLEQLLNDETEAKDNSEQVTDTVPNDKVKEDNHQTSKELVMDEAKENSEQVTDNVPNDEVKEDSHQTLKELVMETTEDPITSAGTASQAEETKQEVAEQFSKISDYWPRSYNEEASLINTVDAEHQRKMMSVVEQPEAEQITHTSTDSTAACEIEEQGEYVYVHEDSGLDTIHEEGREELKVVSDSMPKEVDKMIGSSVGITEDRKDQKEESAVQETQVDQPDVVTETEELTDKAGHEVEVDKLPEEKQQTGLGELPVSQLLMKYILQEECDTLKEARDREYEDVLSKENDGDKHNERKIPKQEEKSASVSVVQLTEETSTTRDKVGSEKLEDSSESVKEEEGYDVKENSDITVCKGGLSMQSTLDQSTSSLVVTENGKDEVSTLSSEMSNNIAKDESMEVNSTEQNSQGSTVGNEHCKPDLVLDEKIEGTVLGKTLMQEEIKKDNETLDKEADVSTFGKTSEEDNLQKEGGQESKECLQDAVKAKGSYEVSDGQSTMDDSEYGEILETKSKIEKVECGDEKQEAGNQEQILKDNSTEEVILSEIQQADHVNEAKIHAQETADKFMEDKNSAIILDRKQMVEAKVDEYKADEEKDEKEEKEEFKLEKSSSNAAIVETKESELKPIQKSEQTTKSSESSKVEDHELEETLQVGSEIKIVESGAKKEDAVNQNQVQMNNGLNEGENLSNSATEPLHMAEKLEEPSSVANVDENHAVQTTETKVDANEAGDVKDEKEEEEEDEHNPQESGQNSTINVEARDAELKPTPKKSHGLFSGVGSKVKHSIAKVKKAITGKSSHSKTVSAK